MTNLGHAVQAAIRRGKSTGARLGTVTAIDATEFALTIDIGTGTPLTGVRWVGSYTPAVNDFVTVLQVSESSWVVLGKLSKNLTGPGFTEHTTQIAPNEWAHAQRMVGESEWRWYSPGSDVFQGRSADDFGGHDYAAAAFYPPIAPLIPSGATITAASIRYARGDDNGLALVAPRLYGHAIVGSPPAVPTNGTSLPWASGFGPLTLSAVAKDASATYPLPSSWVTALMSGALRGVGIGAVTAATYMSLRLSSGALSITYRIPA